MTVEEQPPLRERQAQRVSAEIRRAFVQLVNARGPNGFSLHDVAIAAGVSDRTLYRYYANRDALMQGVRDNELAALDEQLRGQRATIADLTDVEGVAKVFEIFEDHEDLVRCADILRRAEADAGESAKRTDELGASIRSHPGVSAEAALQMVGLIRAISSSTGWMRMTGPDVGLSSREAGYAVHWAIQVLFRAAAAEEGALRPREGGIR